MEVFCLSSKGISALVDALKAVRRNPMEPSLEEVFCETLRVAQDFVPSEAGSVMIGHPEGGLIFVASFGQAAATLPGTRLPQGYGISGQVYRTGEPILVNDPSHHEAFYRGIDEMTEYRTRSLLCVPLKIRDKTWGVLSLLNHLEGGFQKKHLDLLNIFSGYLSISIGSALLAQRRREELRRDPLSGLYNAQYFYDRVAAELELSEANGHGLGLLFLDLDHFKPVVDQYGHLVGSRVLADIGRLVESLIDHPGAAAARYGGDEYVAVFPNIDQDELFRQAEKIRIGVAQAELTYTPEDQSESPFVLESRVTASVGAACSPPCRLKGDTIEAKRHFFIRLADQAMYTAKAQGKNRTVLADTDPPEAACPPLSKGSGTRDPNISSQRLEGTL